MINTEVVTWREGDDIEERLIDFAVAAINLVLKLPHHKIGEHLSSQLGRSGASPAAHYAEARGAESNRDFIHKLNLYLKELNESRAWLKIIDRSKLISGGDVDPVLDECDQLCRIIHASIRTATGGTHHS
jgi:four helix bundle protein